MKENKPMKDNTPKARRIVRIVVSMVLLGAALSLVFRANDEKLAYQPGLGPEFEAIGTEVGTGGLPSRVRHTPTDIVLVLIPPGRFTMGSPKSEARRDGDEVQHTAVIKSAFYLGETEVTVAQWRQIIGALPEEIVHHDDGELPVSGVSWPKAKQFVLRMNTSYATGWRLPTEVEWEYACRAGTTTAFSFGDSVTPAQANYNGQRPYANGERGLRRDRPIPVRSLPKNPWGLYEMHGNLWEWCDDLYVVHPERGDVSNHQARGAARVIRGGAYTSKGKQARSGYRDGYPPSSSGPKYGFRIAMSIPQ